MLRWLRESVAVKPYRPWVERARRVGYAVAGWTGWRLRRLWGALRRSPTAALPLAPATLRHIVVIRPDRIGDVVLSTPALRALRLACPQARLTVIASPVTAPLLQKLPTVDDVLVVGGDRLREFWRARQTLRALRRSRPDVVIALEATWPSAWLAWWLGAPQRVGYELFGMGWLFTHPIPYPFLQRKAHQVDVNLHLLRAAGVPVPATAEAHLEVPSDATAQQRADAWLREAGITASQRLVIIHPGSRSRYTQWAAERFGVVADRLAGAPDIAVVILCGPGEDAIVARMTDAMTTHPPVARQLPLEVVIALLHQAHLFIGNATGTMHLASAVTPHVIAIIGGTHPHDCPERWGPWGNGHHVVHRSPQEVLGHDTWEWLGPEGLGAITPDDVLRAARRMLTS